MLPKKNRFTTSQFDRSFRRSKRWSFGEFTFLESKGKNDGKLSVVVGKKISKSAVKRNRIRRQLYALFEPHLLNIQKKNIICLYNGQVPFTGSERFKNVCTKLIEKISS